MFLCFRLKRSNILPIILNMHDKKQYIATKYENLVNQEIFLDIGKKLKQHRINQNISSKELERLSGVSIRTITGFERGEKNITFISLIELLRALKLLNNLEELIPNIPLVSPLQIMALEKNQKKRVRK